MKKEEPIKRRCYNCHQTIMFRTSEPLVIFWRCPLCFANNRDGITKFTERNPNEQRA